MPTNSSSAEAPLRPVLLPPSGGRPHVCFAFVGDVRGSSRALRQLRALRAMEASVVVLTLGPPPEGAMLADGLPLGADLAVRVLCEPEGRGPLFFWRAHRLFRDAALETPAALYLASDLYTLPGLAAAARRYDARLVFDSRELYAHLDSSAGRPWVRAGWSAVEHRFIRRADAVLTVNQSIAERLSATYGIAPPLVLHNVPEAQAVPRSELLRETLGLPSDRRIVLYQGGLREGRGLPQLIGAVAAVPEAQLVVIGDGPFEGEVRRRAAVLGERARFLPFTPPDRLLAFTASADLGAVLIEPLTESLRLALPNKLFEYLAAGIPVLASPIPEMQRIVETHGVGLIADPDDPDALATALRCALTDETERARWRANASVALDAFRWDRDAARFQHTLSDLLAA